MTSLTGYSVSACIRWENATNGKIPDNAWDAVGDDDVGANLYIGRAEHNGGMFPGTLVPDKGVAHIPWGGKNFQKKDYQVCKILFLSTSQTFYGYFFDNLTSFLRDQRSNNLFSNIKIFP